MELGSKNMMEDDTVSHHAVGWCHRKTEGERVIMKAISDHVEWGSGLVVQKDGRSILAGETRSGPN